MKTPKILVVEDERDVKDLMVLHLKRNGYEPISVENGEEALKILQSEKFDLVILDWMLPGVSGLDICKNVHSLIPVLMVTARSDTSDIVLGLEMGASDYIIKPFEIPIFLARIRALLRRSSGPKELKNFQAGKLKVDIDRHEVFCGEDHIDLTRSEFGLLVALVQQQGIVLSRQKLIDQVIGEEVNVVERAIDTHVFGLRKKLGACGEWIETVRGIGYRFVSELPAHS